MRNAKEMAAKSAIAQQLTIHKSEFDLITQRIDGAANAGLTDVEVTFEGNVFDHDSAERFKQVLLDAGYRVKLDSRTRLGNQTYWTFNISW